MVVVDLVGTSLKNLDHGIEGAKTILVNGAASVRVRNWNNSVIDQEADLLGLVSGWAGHDLGGEVGSEGHELACNKAVSALIANSVVERWAIEQGSQVKCGQSIEDDDLVSGIGVNRLVQREVSRRVVESLVQRRGGVGVSVGEACKPLLQVALALCSGDRRARTVVVVERLSQSQPPRPLGSWTR